MIPWLAEVLLADGPADICDGMPYAARGETLVCGVCPLLRIEG